MTIEERMDRIERLVMLLCTHWSERRTEAERAPEINRLLDEMLWERFAANPPDPPT